MSRGFRWCLVQTTLDLRHSARRGRTLSLPNAQRLFSRRWRHIARERLRSPRIAQLERTGRGMLATTYRRHQPALQQLRL